MAPPGAPDSGDMMVLQPDFLPRLGLAPPSKPQFPHLQSRPLSWGQAQVHPREELAQKSEHFRGLPGSCQPVSKLTFTSAWWLPTTSTPCRSFP